VNAFDPTNRKHLAQDDQPYRSLFASAACLVDTVVDCHGLIDIERVTIVLDAGSRLSDERIRAQIEGGIAQGIGHTLFEMYPAGPLGGQRQINFDRYTMPRLRHMPNRGIDTLFVDPKEGQPVLNKVKNTLGITPKIDLPKELYKGISEVSISPIAPAIANAVIDAIFSDVSEADESRFTHWPITPNEVLQEMPEELRRTLENKLKKARPHYRPIGA
jgi:xanthine dehydrogenase molybdenum-binding subunit